jgi:hypothetical protein
MNVAINTNLTTKEYRLMYYYCAWVTSSIIIAESDEEAIHDADAIMAERNVSNFRGNIALFCGNRKVKKYN